MFLPSRTPLQPRKLFPLCLCWTVAFPLYRFESLDNLDSLRQSPLSTTNFSYPRPHSAAAGYYAPSRNSSSRYSTGGILSQRNTPVDPSNQTRYVIYADTEPVTLAHVVVCHFLCLVIHFDLTLLTCAAPGWSVAGGLAVCVSVPWVVGQPWS